MPWTCQIPFRMQWHASRERSSVRLLGRAHPVATKFTWSDRPRVTCYFVESLILVISNVEPDFFTGVHDHFRTLQPQKLHEMYR